MGQNKTYVGVDIGKLGAIAIMLPTGQIETHKMPKIKDELDYHTLHVILRNYIDSHVVFEKLGVIFGSSKQTAFSMGHQAGAVEMACIALSIPYTKVPARTWQKAMFTGTTMILDSKGKNDTKATALLTIKKLFPTLKLTFGDRAEKPHDGLVDSVLMADYARRMNY